MAFRPYLARIWSSVRSRRLQAVPPGRVCLAQQVQLGAQPGPRRSDRGRSPSGPAPDCPCSSSPPPGPWPPGRAPGPGRWAASSRRWRLISRKSGSRMAQGDAWQHFIPCRRRRTATWSASMGDARRGSPPGPERLRGKVSPLPTDLGGVLLPGRGHRGCGPGRWRSRGAGPRVCPSRANRASRSKAASSPMVRIP